MREILNSGVTGILVSHSLGQVREMCNKILWLDHGKQIAFTDEVALYCDAYEEFLRTKKLPQNRQQVEELAQELTARKQKEKEKAERTEAQRLEAVLEQGTGEAAVQAALSILTKRRPELLAQPAEIHPLP